MSLFIRRLIPMIALLLLIKTDVYADNIVQITQISTGDNNTIDILISGSDNAVDFSFDGATNSVQIRQSGNSNYAGFPPIWGSGETAGGDIAGSANTINVHQSCTVGIACEPNRFEFHIAGHSNTLAIGQGFDDTLVSDGVEAGGSTILLDIHGDSNVLNLYQENTSYALHQINMQINSEYNTISVKQYGDGDKILNLTANNDGNVIDISQTSNIASHTASVTLGGLYGTTLDLTQQGESPQSYMLNQTCMTLGGCSVSVVQGQSGQ
jgi:hypothetical protein